MDRNGDKVNMKVYKIEVFVPEDSFEIVRQAIYNSECGQIGNYIHCLSWSKVFSTWQANEKAQPYIGQRNETVEIEEFKIEFRCNEENLYNTIENIKKAHPYEEACINVMSLEQF